MNKRQFEQLACAGAFDEINPNRAQMAEAAEVVLGYAQTLAQERESGQVSLFGGEDGSDTLGLPPLPSVQPWSSLDQLAREFGAVGFYLSAHPLDSRRQQFENLGIVGYADLEQDMQNKAAGRYQLAGILLKKQERVSAKGNKYAFLQLSDPSSVYEVTLFSDILHDSRSFLETGAPILLTAEAEQREDQIRLTAQKLQPLDDALEHKIRDIHIHLDQAAPIHKLKQFLDIEGEGRAQIYIHARVDEERTAVLQLPGRWALSAQARDIIRGEAGVQAIEEA